MRHASLFSGIGGPEIAAAMIGWDNVFHCEINPFGRQILDYWFPNSDSYEDITKTDFKRYRGSIDVLTGGFPCQPFSYAGKRKGQTDDRYLWPEMLRVIDEIRPTWVIGENVAGITTMVEPGKTTYVGSETPIFEENRGVHRFQSEHTFTIERICQDLKKIGYSVQPVLIPACAVGAPHRRDRVFIIAHSSSSGSESHAQNERTESDRSDKFSQSGKRREQAEFDNRLSALSRPASDSTGKQSKRYGIDKGFIREKQEQSGRVGGESIARMLPGERWDGFPSVSPVHRGNDGFPFDVDCLTIPFAKWRNESIKAYGNAIVPQVMYRIFQCIEQLSL